MAPLSRSGICSLRTDRAAGTPVVAPREPFCIIITSHRLMWLKEAQTPTSHQISYRGGAVLPYLQPTAVVTLYLCRNPDIARYQLKILRITSRKRGRIHYVYSYECSYHKHPFFFGKLAITKHKQRRHKRIKFQLHQSAQAIDAFAKINRMQIRQ